MELGSTALIGHTGFVGSNLLRSRKFAACFNSTNSREIEGKHFDAIICAGFSGTKWVANSNPREDLRSIEIMLKTLNRVTAKKFILISTIDVYGFIDRQFDESYCPYEDKNHSYGKHRQAVEKEILNIFPNVYIVRLPGIYGYNLKKNLIFDLLCNNEVSRHTPDSSYQWYNLQYLNSDIEEIVKKNLAVTNLFSEPVSNARIVNFVFADRYRIDIERSCLSEKEMNSTSDKAPILNNYDLCTKHVSVFENSPDARYRFSAAQVLDQIKKFKENYRI